MRRSLLLLLLTTACGDPAAREPGIDGGWLADAAPPLPTSTELQIVITDGEGGPLLPGRVVLYAEDGTPIHVGEKDMYSGLDQDRGFCALGPGVIGTWEAIILADGTGEIPVGRDRCRPSPAVPFGRYRLVVLQGIEHELYETTVDLGPNRGKVQVRAPLARAFVPEGALSADLHIHAAGSGDSTLPREVRVISEMVAGIKVLGSSDHDLNDSYDDEIDALGVRGQVASLPGDEATGSGFHANVFPAIIDRSLPRNGAITPDVLTTISAARGWAMLRALPNHPYVQLNHPRLRYAAYYDYAGWDGETWPPPFPIDYDAVEVVHGMSAWNQAGDLRIERGVQDLYNFVDHGYVITAVGNSDTHHLSNIVAGVPRNYVFVGDTRLDPFDVDGFVDALRARRVMVTTGPWLAVSAAGASTGGTARAADGWVPVAIHLRQASWSHATRVRVWVGRQLTETLDVPPRATSFDWSGDLQVGGADTWIGVVADGEDGIPVEMHSVAWSTKPPIPPFAMINPILIDADGDGRWTAPQALAKPQALPDLPPPVQGTPRDCEPLFAATPGYAQ